MIFDTLDTTMPYVYIYITNTNPITHDTLDIFQTKNPKNFYHLIFFNLNRYSKWKALPTPVLPFHFAKTCGVYLVFLLLFFACYKPVCRYFFIYFMPIAGSSYFMRLYAVYFYFLLIAIYIAGSFDCSGDWSAD
jgi:hypothetical protein